MNKDSNFFDWLVGLFKKERVVEILPTPEELERQKKWNETKALYSLEFVESYNAYFVKYQWRNQWWYLRRWDEDYTLERVKGNAIRIPKQEVLDSIIYQHQDWIKEGHVFLNYE